MKVKLVLLFTCFALVSCISKSESVTYEVKPRELLPECNLTGFKKVFLAGTIDMGNSTDWQADVKDWFSERKGRYILFNPRRSKWNGGADGEMEYQVNWELEHLEQADIIIMNILGSSKSPVTLLEMGLFARSGKLYVACESDYYRYDNVKITCDYYGVPLYNSIEELLDAVPFLKQ